MGEKGKGGDFLKNQREEPKGEEKIQVCYGEMRFFQFHFLSLSFHS